MLPFLKDRHEGSMSESVETKHMGEFGMIDAIVEDMIEAVHKKDKAMLKECLEALIEHIKSEDEIQDHEEME